MTNTDLIRFQQDLGRDAALRAEFESLAEDLATWSVWARSKGYDLSPDDLADLNEEISDDDLDEVAGGWSSSDPPPPPPGGGG
ncbi:MAG: Nif11-like leader peptide family RiPP precursor [Acidobacteriota bacterium]